MIKHLAVAAITLMLATFTAAEDLYEPQGRFNEAKNGRVIDDWRTGLRWKRCVEGMHWVRSSQTCKGEPKVFTYDEAWDLVRNDPDWDLPDPNDYRSIVDCGNGGPITPLVPMEYAYALYRCEFSSRSTTINENLFPQTPNTLHWARPRYTVRYNSRPHWVVSFASGSLFPTQPYLQGHVRLMNRQAGQIRDAYNAAEREKYFYERSTDQDGMETYLEILPEGDRAAEIRERLDDLLFAKADDVTGLQAYLQRFPEGKHAATTGAKLDDTLASQADSIPGMIRYLELLPKGKQASAIRDQLETELFEQADTVEQMGLYLDHFPQGARSADVKQMLADLRLNQSKEKLAQLGYVPVVDGASVYHETTGLTWSRCSLGQTWDKVRQTCQGSAKIVTNVDVKGGLAIPSGWRLPHIGELRTLYECDKSIFGPNIDSSCSDFDLMINRYVFPGTPSLQKAPKDLRDGYYFAHNGSVLAFDEFKSWDASFLSNLSKPTKGFVRLVKGDMQIATQLCDAVGIYSKDAKYRKSNRMSRSFDWRVEFTRGLPRESFEYYWRDAALRSDGTAESLVLSCRNSFGLEG
jgi:uncharacterized protein DUF1566